MKIVHQLNEKGVEREISGDAGFLLTNKSGGYFLEGINSRYNGLFLNLKHGLFKVIEDIKLGGKVTSITNNLWSFERKRGELAESFFMPMHTNTLVYEVNKHVRIDLLLDVRKPDDKREWGRNYEIFVEKEKIVVKFTKKHDPREREGDENEEYTLYLVIEGDKDLHYKSVGEWVKKEYDFDRKNGLFPHERYVYNAMTLVSKKLIFSVSHDKDEAIWNAELVLANLDRLKHFQRRYHSLNTKHIWNKEITTALNCALNSLDCLLTKDKGHIGIYAGLPFSPQFWSRDEAVSLKALMLENEFDAVKKILIRQLKGIERDGRVAEVFQNPVMSSADAVGWHFKAWHDLVDILSKKGLLEKYFDKQELTEITKRLKQALDSLVRESTKDGLAVNGSKETWMNTIEREGASIEIQALRLDMYKLIFKLTGELRYKEMELGLRNKVRESFWNGEYLADGIDDFTIRPNVFIAAYVYPELLTKSEWEICFGSMLPKLWLDFGGLSTIDKNDIKFSSESQHNGCSWFWINNLAALVLYRTNKKKFMDYIDKISEASTTDILWKGMIGQHSGLSTSEALESRSCLSQAWSSATYIEMVNEVFSRKA